MYGLLTTSVMAQTTNQVLLESPDKTVSIWGELIEAKNGQYVLKTIAGELSMDVNSVSCAGNPCPEVVPDFVAGGEVRLTSEDGTVKLIGKMTKIVDEFFHVESPVLGSFRIRTHIIDCSGPGCPSGLRFASDPQRSEPTTDNSETVETELGTDIETELEN